MKKLENQGKMARQIFLKTRSRIGLLIYKISVPIRILFPLSTIIILCPKCGSPAQLSQTKAIKNGKNSYDGSEGISTAYNCLDCGHIRAYKEKPIKYSTFKRQK